MRPGLWLVSGLSLAKTLQGHKSRPVTMLQARPHAIHFKRILEFGEGQPSHFGLSACSVPWRVNVGRLTPRWNNVKLNYLAR
jgi:hypothetical protein